MKNYTYEKLIAEGDFLKFTLSNLGSHLDGNFETFSFNINATSSHDSFTGKIKVEVIEEGIISFSPELFEMSDNIRLKEALPKVLLSCGIHGNETAPIEICQQLIRAIILGALDLRVNVVFILGNLEAIKTQKRFISHNLNTLYSGNHGLTKIS